MYVIDNKAKKTYWGKTMLVVLETRTSYYGKIPKRFLIYFLRICQQKNSLPCILISDSVHGKELDVNKFALSSPLLSIERKLLWEM